MKTLVLAVALILANNVKKSEGACKNVNKEVRCESVTTISEMTISAIPGISEVTSLYVKFSPSLDISSKPFKAAVKLEHVSINDNKINKIFPNTFKDLPLTFLSLGRNGIKFVFPEAFSNLPLLEQLRFEENALEEIRQGVFANLPTKELTLSKNKIQSIENMALENLPNLRKLRLDGNKLQSIFVHRILTYPERLEILWLHNNSLTTVTNYMLQRLTNLKLLNLGFNSIALIEPNSFEQTPNLNYLVLTNNHLKEIDGSIFPAAGMAYLDKIFLDNNKLMFLSSSFFVRLRSLKKITLIGNPWLCPCLSVVQRLLAENNIQDKCNEDYTSGARPICVNDKVADTECRYSYKDELSEKYENFKREHPLYRPVISCLL